MVLIQAITLFSFFKTLGSCTLKKKKTFSKKSRTLDIMIFFYYYKSYFNNKQLLHIYQFLTMNKNSFQITNITKKN